MCGDDFVKVLIDDILFFFSFGINVMGLCQPVILGGIFVCATCDVTEGGGIL